jgi:5-methylcytosine-specific restriction protein A
MPSIPTSTKCASLGCRAERSRYNNYCLEHGGKNTLIITKARAEHNAMYQTTYWRSIRQRQLSLHPLCAACMEKGRVMSAHHVDHVFPWASIGDSAFYHNIFQSLCASCHSEKTWYEQRGIIKHYGHNDLIIEDYARVCPSSK